MKQALILPGWYQKPTDNWYPWLKQALEKKGYQAYLPDLLTNHTDSPSLKRFLTVIGKLITITPQTVIIGHSLGCLTAMRLAEKYKYKQMFLIAGWDFNDLTYEHRLFWKTPLNHKKIQKNVKQIYCITSDNDPYMTAFQVEEMSKRLKAKFILIKGAGHFGKDDKITRLPSLLKLVT